MAAASVRSTLGPALGGSFMREHNAEGGVDRELCMTARAGDVRALHRFLRHERILRLFERNGTARPKCRRRCGQIRLWVRRAIAVPCVTKLRSFRKSTRTQRVEKRNEQDCRGAFSLRGDWIHGKPARRGIGHSADMPFLGWCGRGRSGSCRRIARRCLENALDARHFATRSAVRILSCNWWEWRTRVRRRPSNFARSI